MLLSTANAVQRYVLNKQSQGPQGNWSIRSQNSSTPDLKSGNAQVEQTITVLGAYDATGLGFGSISTNGGIDCALNFYGGQSATFLQNLSAGQSGSFGNNLSVANQVSATTAILTGTSNNTLSVLNGGIVASDITSNTLFTSLGAASFQGITQVTGPFSIQTTTVSTTPTSGSCTVTGGVGIGGNINAGGNISSLQNITATSQISGATGVFTSTSDASSTTLGSLSTLGGGTIGKSLYIGSDLYTGGGSNALYRMKMLSSTNEFSILPDGNNIAISANTSNVTFGPTLAAVIFDSTTNATNYSTGAVQILGGMSVAQDTYLNGQLFLNGPVSGTSSVQFTNSTVSTAPTNGAVIISAGLGVNHISVGSTVIAGYTAVQSSTSTMTGNLQSRGGIGVVGDAFIGATLNVSGQTNMSSLMTSASATVGNALIVVGTSLLENDVTISSTTVPTSSSTPAALLVAGGIVTTGNSFFKNTLDIGSSLTLEYNSSNTSQLYLKGPSSNQATLGFNSTYNSVALIAPTSYSIRCVSDTGFAFIDGTGVNALKRFSATTSQVLINNANDCTSLGMGGFVTSSGASIALSTIIGKTLTIQSTLDVTSSTNASFITNGGAYIAKSIMIGNAATIGSNLSVGVNFSVTGTSNLTGIVTLSSALTSSSTGSFAGALMAGGTISAQSSSNSSWAGPSSTVSPTGSLISYGGAVVEKDFYVGGNEVVYGNTNLQGTCQINGVTTITSTVTSSSPTNQALIVTGGTSLNSGVIVTGASVLYGDTFVSGNLVVNGTTSTINSVNTNLRDNIFGLNIGSRNLPDCGLAFGRDQESNNNSTGFIVTDTPAFKFTVASTASDLLTVKLPSSSSTVDNFYQNCWIQVISGTGAGQVRFVDTSSGSGQTLTIRSTAQQTTYNTANPPPTGSTNAVIGLDFATAPDSTSIIAIYNTCYGMFLQQQLANVSEWRLGYATNDIMGNMNNTNLTKLGTLRLATLAAATSVQSDQYQPYTVGDNIVLNNSVTISSSGDVSGVNTFNGSPSPIYLAGITVSETASGSTGATTLPINKTYGIINYTITSPDGTGSTSSGEITCNITSSTNGSPNTATTCLPGQNGEQVGIIWNYGSSPQITLFVPRASGNLTGSPVSFNLSLIVQ